MNSKTIRNRLAMLGTCTAVVIALTWARPCLACIWDSDTLDHELKKFPGIEQVITGRFERNPPLYYQMRLARATQETRERPGHLEAYDDAGASCDRLGPDQDAIVW